MHVENLHYVAIVEAGAALGTFGVAVLAAKFGRRQVKLAGRDRRDRQRPFVAVDLTTEGSDNLIFLSVQNFGQTVARDVRISIRPEPWKSNDTEIEQYLAKFLTEPIPTLPPGRRHVTVFAQMVSRSAEPPTRFDVQVECRGPRKAPFADDYVLNLDLFRNLIGTTRDDGLPEISETLKELNRSVKSLVSLGPGFESAIRVNTYNRDDRERAARREEAEIAEHARRYEPPSGDDVGSE